MFIKRGIFVCLLLMCVGIAQAATSDRVLKKTDIQTYKNIFLNQKKSQFNTARQSEKKLTNKSLLGYVLFDRYFSKKYPTSQKEIIQWMDTYSDLPVAVDIYALGRQKNIKNLKRPKGLFGSNTKACSAPSRQEPIDLVSNLSLDYLSGEEKTNTSKKMREFIRLLSKGHLEQAETALNEKALTHPLKQHDLDKARTALAFSYLLSGNNEKALDLSKQAMGYYFTKVPLSLWVAGLANWRLGNLEDAADYFSDLADMDDASTALRVRAAYWAARAYLGSGKYTKVVPYLEKAATAPRNFYGMLAARALGQDLNYVWDTPSTASDEIAANFSHPALERFYALRQIGQDEWASQELSKLYLEADDEAKGLLMMISEKNKFDDALMSLTGTLQGEEARYPMPAWEPQGGWQLDKALVYAFVRQESCFNNRAESYVGALGLMQIMPDTAKETAQFLQCRFSKHSLKDPAYNLRLGQAYLMRLMNEYPQVQNNLMFLAAAYNAGPGNLNKWQNQMSFNDDPLLFLEVLPSKETRGFIERILVNYWIYRNLMGQSLETLDDVVQGKWPLYIDAAG
ncbi:MAG: lytic transglycosylase domain-containing protein [Alphaproteobacteria bacterium]|nr:lytic transglycosylase domain-containing protein [Alphaproteobacteria bacterium]